MRTRNFVVTKTPQVGECVAGGDCRFVADSVKSGPDSRCGRRVQVGVALFVDHEPKLRPVWETELAVDDEAPILHHGFDRHASGYSAFLVAATRHGRIGPVCSNREAEAEGGVEPVLGGGSFGVRGGGGLEEVLGVE